jgi:predicted MPP superfamily phosphohydrolase
VSPLGRRAGTFLGALAAAGLAWGWFEAGWVRYRVVAIELDRLPRELDGLRIAHLSDFHLGVRSRGARAVERAVEWTAARAPDLTVVTGDLLSKPRAYSRLVELLDRLPNAYAVLGNHDPSNSLQLGETRLLVGDSVTLSVRGCRLQIVGVDPRAYRSGTARPERHADAAADLRILLCHYPRVVDRLPPDAYDLVLAGHMHAGQIALPLPGGKLRFNPYPHLNWRYSEGVYRAPSAVMHVSPGLGTTFVPFRFAARPEATELVLQSR